MSTILNPVGIRIALGMGEVRMTCRESCEGSGKLTTIVTWFPLGTSKMPTPGIAIGVPLQHLEQHTCEGMAAKLNQMYEDYKQRGGRR